MWRVTPHTLLNRLAKLPFVYRLAIDENDQSASRVENTSTNAAIDFAEMPCFDCRFELQRTACGFSGAILDLRCSHYSSAFWEILAAEDNRERHQHGADADHREAGADAAHAGIAGEQAARCEEHRDGDTI
jgi:hypothetical protein